jgi:hypothetical protein
MAQPTITPRQYTVAQLIEALRALPNQGASVVMSMNWEYESADFCLWVSPATGNVVIDDAGPATA